MKRVLAFILSIVCTLMLVSLGLSNWILNTPAVSKATTSFVNAGGKIENYTFDGTNESSINVNINRLFPIVIGEVTVI